MSLPFLTVNFQLLNLGNVRRSKQRTDAFLLARPAGSLSNFKESSKRACSQAMGKCASYPNAPHIYPYLALFTLLALMNAFLMFNAIIDNPEDMSSGLSMMSSVLACL